MSSVCVNEASLMSWVENMMGVWDHLILVTRLSTMWIVTTMSSVCVNEASLMSWAENMMGVWDHLILVTRLSTTT
jgi:hypothetical protein